MNSSIMNNNSIRRRNGAILAACITVGLLAFGLLVLKSYDRIYRPGFIDTGTARYWGTGKISSSFIRVVGNMYDSKGQSLALRLPVLALALFLLLAPFLKKLPEIFDRSFWRRSAYAAITLAMLAAYAFCVRRGVIRPRAVLRADLSWISNALAFALLAGYVRRGLINKSIGLLVLALIAVAELPGLITRLDLSALDLTSSLLFEHHFSCVVGQSERLAAGHPLLEMVKPNYGFFLQFSLAVFERDVRLLSTGETIQVLQGLQFLYLLLCVIIFLRQGRGKWPLCLLATLLVLPWYVFNHRALLYPNQSAWRTLGFPLALIAIHWAYYRTLAYSSFALGCLAGATLLINVEAGIATTAGLFAALFYRTRFFEGPGHLRDLIRISPFFPGIATACLLFSLVWRLLLGYWPDPLVLKDVFDRLRFWSSSGFGGVRFPGHLLPLALFCSSCFQLAYSALSPSGRRSSANSVRIGAAAISLVWLSYYVNRADYWNLSSFGLLWAIPAIDAARFLITGVRFRRLSHPAVLLALVTTGVITLQSIGEMINYNRQMNLTEYCTIDPFKSIAPRFARRPGTEELSGLILNRETANEIETKARALHRLSHDKQVIYLTMHSYLMPKVSGICSWLPIGDIIAETLTEREYEQLLDYIKLSGTREIFIDPLDIKSESGLLESFVDTYRRLLLDLRPLYQFDRSVDGWEIWVRKQVHPAEARRD
jgi:hypothetical protein